MYIFRRNPDFMSIGTLVRCYSILRKSHYEVLNLRRDCSDKDIKEAFIKKSKQYHPDKNKDARAQDNFVRIVEAYNVLGKPNTRAQYDRTSEIDTNNSYVYRPPTPYNMRSSQYGFYEHQTYKRSTSNAYTSYYGTNTTRKIPNMYIIMICFGIAFVGTMLQMVVIREIYTTQQQQAREKSKTLTEELNRVRTAAQDNGNELQTRLLLDKIVAAANPTVATASLGQALANEKK